MQFEKTALEALIAAKNTRKFEAVNGVRTIPDLPVGSRYGITEIKDRKAIFFTKQLRAQAAVAEKQGLPLNLIVSPRAETISKPLPRRIEELGGRIFIFSAETGQFIDAVIEKGKVLH